MQSLASEWRAGSSSGLHVAVANGELRVPCVAVELGDSSGTAASR